MNERLRELQRQRALVEEQLAWLDREISREAPGLPSPSPIVVPTATPRLAAAIPPKPALDVDRDADQIISQYREAGGDIRSDVRKGCLMYFFAAFGLLVTGVLALYLLRSR